MGEVALENGIKLHFFKINLRFQLEAHKKDWSSQTVLFLPPFQSFLICRGLYI